MPFQTDRSSTAYPGACQPPRRVQGLFSRIARRYDLMNRIMTLGQDRGWRREVIQRASLPVQGRLLDLGAGTGDLVLEAVNHYPGIDAMAVDFTPAMMEIGRARFRRNRPGATRVKWINGDALRLPLADRICDAVVSAFLMRNVSDITLSLREQHRVLKEGGRIVILDTTPAGNTPLSPLVDFYWRVVVPQLGQWVAGDREAYAYLTRSTRKFLHAERLASQMLRSGFQEVGFRRLMFSTVAIHWGRK